MNTFVAGASGAIGRPLIAELIRRGHTVTGMTRSDVEARRLAALTAPPGVYHVVDDDPSPVIRWLPAFAKWVGAPPPPHVTEQEPREAAGDDAVYYGTMRRGATNGKAKRHLGFAPRRLSWLSP